MRTDTIAAIATAMSSSGIGIIRISGDEAVGIVDRIFSMKNGKKLSDMPTHTIHYGHIKDGDEVIDEVMVVLMRAPKSYTKEDTVEIDCHGGVYVMKRVLETVIKYGARPAEPGEFTKRAFLNGRIDLAQAESVIDIIHAKNEFALKSSEQQLSGSLSAADGLVLLSQGAGTEADAYVNENEAPEFAVDGDVSTKWCATGAAPHEITLDLGEVNTVSAVDIFHAEAGGESADMNTKSYTILVSQDGNSFEEVYSVTKNTNGTTHNAFTPKDARYVKLVVNKPTQGSDSAARIYEIEVYGIK